jgi:hypothetical protein
MALLNAHETNSRGIKNNKPIFFFIIMLPYLR